MVLPAFLRMTLAGFAGALVITFSLPASAFYDPFEDVTAIAPSDELEARMWDESRLLRSQLIRPEHQPSLKATTQLVQSVFARHFPALQNVIRLHVYRESELAVVGTPHGEIFLSSGLMLRLESEEDLVVIIARELAHVYQRDSARTLSYARTGSNLKEIFSTSLAAYNVTSGLMNLNSLAGSLTSLSPDLLLKQLQLTPEKLLESGGSIFAKLLKERLQEDLEGLGRNLGGVLVHRLSVQAVAALVKTSLYGYSDRIENQADLFALTFLQERYGHVEHYEKLVQRLLEQSTADGDVPFLSFYSNSKRLKARLDSANDWKKSPSPVPIAVQLSAKNPLADVAAGQSPAGAVALWRMPVQAQTITADGLHAQPPSQLANESLQSGNAKQEAEEGVEVSVVLPVPSAPPSGEFPDVEPGSNASPISENASGVPPEAASETLTEVIVQATSEQSTHESHKDSGFLVGDLRTFFLETLEQESRQGAPRRFLANLDRLHSSNLIDPQDTRSFETRVLRATKQQKDTEKALGLLQADLLQRPQDWNVHQLIADLYVELKTYDQAISHYSQALELAGNDERSLFILDRKTRAENLLARESRKK
ncbi:MAG TPA: M48 family metalloprotease [Limnobacter sp.]|nr:M48 family metalloprotease [Limnobacter sp.]